MLTRTTAQRVETAAFCDSMLADGFPLARISNDTDHDCGVCSEWEGRLIDLSAGHQLGSGTYTLQEAREAGLFHPNCLHRLEYVSISEIPKSLWPKVKDKIGVPGAFGDNKTATTPDLQTNAERKKHVKQVETAAEEKAKEESDEIIRLRLEENGVVFRENLKRIDQKLLSENLKQLDSLIEEYPAIKAFVMAHGLDLSAPNIRDRNTVAQATRPNEGERIKLELSKLHFANYDAKIEESAKSTKTGFSMPCTAENYAVYTITHEFGHIVQFALEQKYIEDHRMEYEEALNAPSGAATNTPRYIERLRQEFLNKIDAQHSSQISNIAHEIKPNLTSNEFYESISRYAICNDAEFFAESFANAKCGEPNVIGRAMCLFLERNAK
ncbi:MAG: hypothetical protein IKW38_05945 [Kiritimatiellae bacterium]|nr:hypothetical protein [Kiritimatiellia bacterium]